jgi:hypothetical protein
MEILHRGVVRGSDPVNRRRNGLCDPKKTKAGAAEYGEVRNAEKSGFEGLL